MKKHWATKERLSLCSGLLVLGDYFVRVTRSGTSGGHAWFFLKFNFNFFFLSSVWVRQESEQLLLADLAISQKRETELDPEFLGKPLGSSTC